MGMVDLDPALSLDRRLHERSTSIRHRLVTLDWDGDLGTFREYFRDDFVGGRSVSIDTTIELRIVGLFD